MRKGIIWIVTILFAAAGVFLLSKCQQAQAQEQRPNIVIVLADDLGWGDVGYHGSEIMTPNLDKLSEEAVVLNRFYVAPVCSPTRAGLLTGRYPDRFGLRETVIPPWRDFGLDPNEELLPEMLASAGYKNRAILGKWHLGHSSKKYYPLENGFTHFYGHLNGAIDYFTHEREGELDWHNDWESSYDKGYSTDLLTDEAVKCIKNYAKEGPFLVYVAYNAPHTPLQAKEEDLKLYGYDPSQKKANAKGGKGASPRQTYSAMVTNMDRGIGRIQEAIREAGIEKNTFFLFFSDNGGDEGSKGGSSRPLRGHKFHEWDGGVRVPALVKWPDGFSGGRKIEQVTGYVDVVPTIKEIAGINRESPRALDGISVLSVLKGEKESIDRHMYLGMGALVTNEWKIVKANRNPKMKVPEDMLFKINQDELEKTNVAKENPEVFKKMDQLVLKYDTIKSPFVLPPYDEGREGFKAPKEWKVD